MSKADQPEQPEHVAERAPVPPNTERVEAIVLAMSIAAGQYCQLNSGNMSDVLSACFTMTHRTVESLLYHTTPPLNVREQFRMRGVVVGACERLWIFASGGGATSRHKAH